MTVWLGLAGCDEASNNNDMFLFRNTTKDHQKHWTRLQTVMHDI